MATTRAGVALAREELVALLEPFVSSRTWLQYSEAQVQKAETQRKAITQHADFLTSLRARVPNLSINKTLVQAAFTTIAGEKGDSMGLLAEHRKDWIVTMTARL
eukprot:13934376-Alexandrium_andersonii.AAC.1